MTFVVNDGGSETPSWVNASSGYGNGGKWTKNTVNPMGRGAKICKYIFVSRDEINYSSAWERATQTQSTITTQARDK